MSPRKVVILPWIGEFGVGLLHHVPKVHDLPAAEKIVCCQPGEQILFPSATGFYTDWQPPVDERDRIGPALGRHDDTTVPNFYRRLRPRLRETYSGYEILAIDFQARAPFVPCHVRPIARPVLPPVDLAISPRLRRHIIRNNWPHWTLLADAVTAAGFSLGVVGTPLQSTVVAALTHAWDHPDGITSGAVDILDHCKLYLGCDSGATHLACMMRIRTVVLLCPRVRTDNVWTRHMRAVNPAVTMLPPLLWNHPRRAVARVLNLLQGRNHEPP